MSIDESQPIQSKSYRRSWRFWFGSLLSLVALVWLLFSTDWPATWAALTSTNYWLVLGATLINLMTIPIRSYRWRLMFPPTNRPPFGKLTAIMLIGQMINLFMPARLGEIVRASLVDTKPFSFVLGTQFFRIVLDTIMVAVLIIILLFQLSLPEWWRGPGEALLVSSLLVILSMGLLLISRNQLIRILGWFERKWPFIWGRSVISMGESFLESLDVVSSPTKIITLLALSIVLWVIYALVNNVLLVAIGEPASWLTSVFLLVVLMLSIAVPSSPGRVGIYHYLAVQALSVFGVDQSTAVSYSIILHFITIMVPSILGAILAWQQGVGVRPTTQR